LRWRLLLKRPKSCSMNVMHGLSPLDYI